MGNKSLIHLVFLLLIVISFSTSCIEKNNLYTIAKVPWQEDLGNNRTVLEVSSNAESVYLEYLWRRPDKRDEETQFIIISKVTGQRVSNIHLIAITNEQYEPAKVLLVGRKFQPVHQRYERKGLWEKLCHKKDINILPYPYNLSKFGTYKEFQA